jgi:hypothetical protein
MIFRILTLPMAKKNEVCSIRARHAYWRGRLPPQSPLCGVEGVNDDRSHPDTIASVSPTQSGSLFPVMISNTQTGWKYNSHLRRSRCRVIYVVSALQHVHGPSIPVETNPISQAPVPKYSHYVGGILRRWTTDLDQSRIVAGGEAADGARRLGTTVSITSKSRNDRLRRSLEKWGH